MGIALIIPNIDFSGANLGRVTLAQNIPLESLSISGASEVLGGASAATYEPIYNPATTNQRAVTWSVVAGGTYATITAGGVLTVLSGASEDSVTIRVTSQVNQSIYAEKTISVTYAEQPADLPDGALACDMLFSDGKTAYIESGFVPGQAMSFEAEIFWATPGNSQGPFASFINNNRYDPFRWDGGKMYACYKEWHLFSDDVYAGILHVKEKAILTKDGAHLEIYQMDGTLVASYDQTFTETMSPTDALALLGTKTSSTAIVDGSFRGGLGRVKAYGDNHYGQLVADFIPCYYNGNFGFWDAVGEEMHIGNTPAKIGGSCSSFGTQGFLPHVTNHGSNAGYLQNDRDEIVSRFIAVPSGCTQVRFRAGSSPSASWRNLLFVNSGGTSVGLVGYGSADQVSNVPSGAAKMRLGMEVADMDNCYIYDVTNDSYIWKGKNVV